MSVLITEKRNVDVLIPMQDFPIGENIILALVHMDSGVRKIRQVATVVKVQVKQSRRWMVMLQP